MKWYKRLFWKIFAAIWSISCVVLLASVVLVGLSGERDRFKDVLNAKAQGFSLMVVERYERRGFRSLPAVPLLQPPKERRHDKPSHHRRAPWLNMAQRIRITDLETNRSVIQGNAFNPKPEHHHSFEIESNAGRRYLVEIDQSWNKSPMMHTISVILSVQIFLIILVSALAALLVSAIIVRPLNKLREHTQAIYRGELDSRTDEKLRKRGDELGELAREFDQMADYVQQTLNSHQRLMQDVSHELRAPLARLQAAAGLAEQRLGEGDKTVERIIRESERLDRLIGEILSLSRLEQMETSGKKVLLGDVIGELVGDARFSYPDREFNLNRQSQCTVQLNTHLLERAVNNILGNACKHTPETAAIDITLAQEQGCIITIRDHGTGVSASALEQLCNPFYRASHETQGYGLGLSIAKRAVERLSGELLIRNHPQGGLEVTIKLPCAD